MKKQVFYWEVTVIKPGICDTLRAEPIARDKMEAAKRAAAMIGEDWKQTARYMTVRGPFKASSVRVRQWNATYPAWSTERDAASAPSGNLPPRGRA